jgi:hypothetical protein
MATISTSQDFDSASRSAGEAFTVNSGAVLTINTDTRWHKNAPTGAGWGTGTIGAITLNVATGGTILIDATDVKCISYTSGSGNVPTLGTTITGNTSGVTGELLGVYSAISAAPTAAGSAMPASGFIKFKSTSGTFNSSESLTGISATTNAAMTTGWLEIVRDEGTDCTISRTSLFQSIGDWFYLADTTGTRNQTLQLPNAGGSNTHYAGVWIEDGFLTGAIADDGGSTTDQTGNANSTAGTLTLLPSTPAVNDAYYFGYNDATFTTLQILISTQGVGTWTITWEYYNGSSWAALSGVSDGTSGFTAATGWQAVTWTLPGDWAKTTIRDKTAYFVRARVSAYSAVTTAPAATMAGINGSGIYEIWPAIQGTTYFGSSHMGLDRRSQFVNTIGSGQLRIGYNGSADMGALPVKGCKTRTPNILLVSCTTAARASNTVPNSTLATRPDFTTTSAGRVEMSHTNGNWYFSLAQAYTCELEYCATFDQISITECATEVIMNEVGIGNYTHADSNAMVLTSNFFGGTCTKCNWGRSGTIGNNDYGTNMTYCYDFTFTKCHFGNRGFRTTASGYPGYFAYCGRLTFTDPIVVGHNLYFLACSDVDLTNYGYADSYHTTASATGVGLGALYFGAGCVNVKCDGGNWWSSQANIHHDAAFLYCLGATNVRWQNVGTLSYPLSGGSTNTMLYAFSDGGNNDTIELKRVYFTSLATRFANGVNSTNGMLVENCSGDSGDALGTSGTAGFVFLRGYIKNLMAASQYTAFTSVYGTIFYNLYTSTSAGRLGLSFNEPTSEQDTVTTSFTGASGFTSTGSLAIQVLNDYIIYEYPYKILGIDSFQNSSPTLSGTNTSNHTVEYQIDTGSGWNGSWKTANGTNLSGETFSATTGFYLKIRITCNTASTTNALTDLYILTNANAAAQAVTYPLDTCSVSVAVYDVETLDAIQGARVLLLADSGGPKPSDETVTITNSGTTATVSHTAHGLETGDKVQIKSASLAANNGIFTATVTDANTYTYTMSSSPGSNPTGTIKATFVALSDTTDSVGEATATLSLTDDQPITGRVRKATSGTLYKTASVVGTIDAIDGFSTNILMIEDQ